MSGGAKLQLPLGLFVMREDEGVVVDAVEGDARTGGFSGLMRRICIG